MGCTELNESKCSHCATATSPNSYVAHYKQKTNRSANQKKTHSVNESLIPTYLLPQKNRSRYRAVWTGPSNTRAQTLVTTSGEHTTLMFVTTKCKTLHFASFEAHYALLNLTDFGAANEKSVLKQRAVNKTWWTKTKCTHSRCSHIF